MKVMDKPKASQADKLAEQIRSEQGELDTLKAQLEQADAAAVAAVADDGAYREASAKAQDLKGAVDAKAGRVEHLGRAFTDCRRSELASAAELIGETKSKIERMQRPVGFRIQYERFVADAKTSTGYDPSGGQLVQQLNSLNSCAGVMLAKLERTGVPEIGITELSEIPDLLEKLAQLRCEAETAAPTHKPEFLRRVIRSIDAALEGVNRDEPGYVEFMTKRRDALQEELDSVEAAIAPIDGKVRAATERLKALEKKIGD